MKFSALAALSLLAAPVMGQDLGGQTFDITVVEADGFVSKAADGTYEGYIIEMIEAVAASAGFSYNLKSPSGFGANCSPQLPADATEGIGADTYASSFLCGQDDTLTAVPDGSKTDMYWSIFFVTEGRQAAGKFSLRAPRINFPRRLSTPPPNRPRNMKAVKLITAVKRLGFGQG